MSCFNDSPPQLLMKFLPELKMQMSRNENDVILISRSFFHAYLVFIDSILQMYGLQEIYM